MVKAVREEEPYLPENLNSESTTIAFRAGKKIRLQNEFGEAISLKVKMSDGSTVLFNLLPGKSAVIAPAESDIEITHALPDASLVGIPVPPK
jgi:hypothetical protein